MKRKKLPVKISIFTILFAVLWCIFGNGQMLVVYFLSLLLHETAHKIVAKKLGYSVGQITISPLGATLYADTDEFSPKDEFYIALAGPVMSICLALLCVCTWWIYPEFYNYTMDFCMANFSMFLLNLLPIFPLDGGRILAACLSKHMPRKSVSKVLCAITIIFGVILIFLTIISVMHTFNYTFGVVGIFLICSLLCGNKENSYKRVLDIGKKRKKLMHGIVRKNIIVPTSMPLVKVFSLIDISGYFVIHVVDENFNEKFQVGENEFLEIMKNCDASMQIGQTRIDKRSFDW